MKGKGRYVNFDELMAELPPEQRVRVEEGAEQLLAEVRAYRLSEVRQRQGLTQTQVAERLGISQARVSEIERGKVTRSEVDTLARYIGVLGGELEVIANFGDERLRIA
ncbi:XRE family transcriptional regulator [Actinomadura alba]|uniref:XRE family transcriptional regulator n=1 Tax=Actinomadura alba TaxID=406431 RepID=A0ABR7LQ66_9ACTN|nr:XRE family transcriptional regulator [Actinomadura alba]MBC6466890.1 XRE family transcriptional regulator [Actinomadura alba]